MEDAVKNSVGCGGCRNLLMLLYHQTRLEQHHGTSEGRVLVRYIHSHLTSLCCLFHQADFSALLLISQGVKLCRVKMELQDNFLHLAFAFFLLTESVVTDYLDLSH